MDVFQSMLFDLGIDSGPILQRTAPPSEPDSRQRVEYHCCGQLLWEYRLGFLSCPACGKVHDHGQYMYVQESWRDNEPCGARQSMVIERKRFYRPLNHFKEHLRRYMGNRFTTIPDNLLKQLHDDGRICVQHCDVYFAVKQKLKELKLTKLYKEIFTLIYAMGGERPILTNQQYTNCIRSFTLLMHVFQRRRTDFHRHSMPSMYVMLDMLLRKHGHTPYYTIPKLKNQKLLDNVYEIIQTLEDDGGVGRLV